MYFIAIYYLHLSYILFNFFQYILAVSGACLLAVYIINFFVIGLPLWDAVSMNLSKTNMLYSQKTFAHITPLPPHNGHLSKTATFSCPQGGSGSTVVE